LFRSSWFERGEALQFAAKTRRGLDIPELPAAILRLQNSSFAGWAGEECI